MNNEERVRYGLMKTFLFISAVLGFLPKILFNVLILPAKFFRLLAMLCIPKKVKSQLVSHRLDKKRNLKCHCGSGKKYKNCHWRKDKLKARQV